ncbi:SDR family NAD(P)-dependent oxidoreductase [Leptolyngbya sp. AN03gr2]|uniref:SDR family NAD(P)-dependent oxidoreductase n=1 Tax=unclassified Leptolyngbya TaxID=2650499 RepID=UPI003D3155BC
MLINPDGIPSLIAGIGGTALTSLLLDRWWRSWTYDLNGKITLITGGSRGLGLVMARQLIALGAKVAICARDAEELQRARTELEQRGGEVLALTCDVTDQAQVNQMIRQVREHWGAIDILINNAGTDIIGPVESLTVQDYDDLMKLHFWASLYTMNAVVPEMQARKAGRIVNVSSVGGKIASPHMVAYCASKFALVGLSEGMRAELAKDGISVTTVCPGFIRTGVLDHGIIKGQHKKEFAWFSIGDSLPIVAASAEKVARTTIAAFRRGQAEVIVPFPTWLTVKLYGLSPALMTNLLGVVNRLLPKPGGIGTERAFGKDSHSAWSDSVLTELSDRAARQNNELTSSEPKENTTVELIESEPKLEKQIEADQDQSFTASDTQISSEVQACLSEVQDTLGIPWTPANWEAYSKYPAVMQLFWKRLKPVMQTEPFLESAIALTEQVYRNIADWYQPNYQTELDERQRRQIQRELNAFSFGNPQLLIQQIALSRALSGEVVGEDGKADVRRGPNAYRHPEIKFAESSEELQRVYQDIQQALGMSIVPSDHQALARWSGFFSAGWEDIKLWRDRPEYQLLKQSIVERAENAASRLRPAVFVGEDEIRDRLDNPDEVEQIRQMVQMFTEILPDLMIQDALFHAGLAGLQPVVLSREE